MNEQLQQALTELCAKLGTTVEHLWEVLIKQAYISGITNTIVIAIWTVALVFGFKFVHRKTTVPPKTEENEYPSAEWEDEGKVVSWCIWSFFLIIIISVIGCEAEGIIGSLFNPEYWALTKLIH